jgi:hypothetical protein
MMYCDSILIPSSLAHVAEGVLSGRTVRIVRIDAATSHKIGRLTYCVEVYPPPENVKNKEPQRLVFSSDLRPVEVHHA